MKDFSPDFLKVCQLFLKQTFVFRFSLLMGLSKLNENQLNTERGEGRHIKGTNNKRSQGSKKEDNKKTSQTNK